MLRPTNTKKQRYHTSISSNQVIWDGPDIPCIELCKGDRVTEVVYKLANELCKVVEDLNPESYNLECLNLSECADITFQQLFQTLITTVFCGDNPLPPTDGGGDADNCCDDLEFIPRIALYVEDIEPTIVQNAVETNLPLTEYTVPSGQAGIYEVMFNMTLERDATNDSSSAINFYILVDNVQLPISRPFVLEPSEFEQTFPFTLFKSNINLSAGDVITIGYDSSDNFSGRLRNKVFKLTKIG